MIFQAFFTGLHSVAEDRGDAQNFRSGCAQRFRDVDSASGSGDQIFDNDDLGAGFTAAFDLVVAAVVLDVAADIAHRDLQDIRYQRGMRDTGGAGAHDHLTFRIMTSDDLCQRLFDIIADSDIGKGQTVVTVDRGFDPACPGKGFFRTQEYGFDLQQVSCDSTLHVQSSSNSWQALS